MPAAIVAALVLLLTTPALAEAVRWRTADGREGFSDRTQVPAGAAIVSGSKPSTLTVHESPVRAEPEASTIEETPATPAAPAPPAGESEEQARARWAEKRAEAQRELREAEKDVRIYAECKEHEDHDWGYNKFATRGCDEYGRGALKEAKARRRQAKDYLENGLYEECRRAPDCQPGYLR